MCLVELPFQSKCQCLIGLVYNTGIILIFCSYWTLKGLLAIILYFIIYESCAQIISYLHLTLDVMLFEHKDPSSRLWLNHVAYSIFF